MSGTLEATVRAELETERASLRAQLEHLGGLEVDHGHADSSQAAAEVGEARALADNLGALLNEVVRALDKLDAGTYGTCEVCGDRITEPRLEAMPATRYCVQHA